MKIEEGAWKQAVATNAMVTSFTMNGLPNIDNPVDGAISIRSRSFETSAQANRNLEVALERAWQSRWKNLDDQAMRLLLTAIAQTITAGSSASAPRELYRTKPLGYRDEIPVTRIEAELCKLIGLMREAHEDGEHPIFAAAVAERALAYTLRPFPDGCVRLARVMGAFIMLSADCMPPMFNDRTEVWDKMRGSSESWQSYYAARCKAK